MVKGLVTKGSVTKGAAKRGAAGRAATGGATVTTPTAGKRNSEVGRSAADPVCGGCGQLVNDGVRALQCDHCQSSAAWRCADCVNLSGDVYDALMGEAGASLKWFCESCEKEISSLKTQSSSGNQKLDRIMDLMQRFLDTYEHMDTRLSEKADVDITSQLEVRL